MLCRLREARAVGVPHERALPDDRVLMHPHGLRAEQLGAERERPVRVVDHGDLAGQRLRELNGRVLQQVAVGRIPGAQLGATDIRLSRERGEHRIQVGHVSTVPVPRFSQLRTAPGNRRHPGRFASSLLSCVARPLRNSGGGTAFSGRGRHPRGDLLSCDNRRMPGPGGGRVALPEAARAPRSARSRYSSSTRRANRVTRSRSAAMRRSRSASRSKPT